MNRSVREKSRDYQWFKDTGLRIQDHRYTKKHRRQADRFCWKYTKVRWAIVSLPSGEWNFQ